MSFLPTPAPKPVWSRDGHDAALQRFARPQIEGSAPQERERGAGGAEFNVWYGKFNTLRENRDAERAGAKALRDERCNSFVDAGRTRATERGALYFCQYFARGVCSNGRECAFFHLVPTAEDCATHDKNPTVDIFGRQRHADEKQNRAGVGSFFSMSRTLYVGYGAATEALGSDMQAAFERVFSEWGPVEDIYIVRTKSIAFVRYVFRASAEFAKESLGNQSLLPPWWPKPGGGGKAASAAASLTEVLIIRWAYDDPNPVAIRRNKREREEAFADFTLRAESRLAPDARAAVEQQRALDAAVAERPTAAALASYPSTDAQFGGGGSGTGRDDAGRRALAPQSAAGGGGRAAPDAHEYDADDPYYACEVEEVGPEEAAEAEAALLAARAAQQHPPPQAQQQQQQQQEQEQQRRSQHLGGEEGESEGVGAAGATAPLSLLVGYGSDGDE